MFGRKIFLELFVKVRPKWRENPEFLNAVDWRSMTGREADDMRVLSVVLILSLLTAVCAPLVAQSKISDDQIYDEVRRKLADDTTVKGGALEVEVKEGVVTLSGKVKSEKQKNKAESLTKKVKGVTKVVNELVVEP